MLTSSYVNASFDALMRQAPDTAALYLRKAAEAIDQQFGEGYAKANPALVAAFMSVAGQDFANAMNNLSAQVIKDGLDVIAESLSARGG